MSRERMRQEKENTLRRILDKAWEIAIDEGVNGVSIRKLATALNFAPNNLYNYFENKNELLKLLKKDSYQWSIDIIQSLDCKKVGICEMFKEISEKLLGCALKEPEKYIIMTSDVIMDNHEPLDRQLTDIFAEKIREGIAAGELAEVDPIITAVNIRTIQIGFVRMVTSNKDITEEKAYKMHDNLMNILFDGIRRR